jgi:hypothetical protein
LHVEFLNRKDATREIVPRRFTLVHDVEQSVSILFDKMDNCFSNVSDIAGSAMLIAYDAKGWPLAGQAQHRIHKVRLRGFCAMAVQPTRSQDDVPATCSGRLFPKQFGLRVYTLWLRYIRLRVRSRSVSVAAKDIIATNLDQLRSRSLGGSSEMFHGRCINLVALVRFVLGTIDRGVSTAIYDCTGLLAADDFFDLLSIRNIQIGMRESNCAVAKPPLQLEAELPVCSSDGDQFGHSSSLLAGDASIFGRSPFIQII